MNISPLLDPFENRGDLLLIAGLDLADLPVQAFEPPQPTHFTVNKPAILAEIAAERPDWAKAGYIEQYHRNELDGEKQSRIAQDYNVVQKQISAHVRRVAGSMSERIGHAYEQFVAKRLHESGKYDRVTCNGAKSEPDVWATRGKQLFVWSCKAYECTKTVSIPIAELQAELDFARNEAKAPGKWDSVQVFLQFINLVNNDEQTIGVTLVAPSPIFTFPYNKSESPVNCDPLPSPAEKVARHVAGWVGRVHALQRSTDWFVESWRDEYARDKQILMPEPEHDDQYACFLVTFEEAAKILNFNLLKETIGVFDPTHPESFPINIKGGGSESAMQLVTEAVKGWARLAHAA